jgi:hypothetical protein
MWSFLAEAPARSRTLLCPTDGRLCFCLGPFWSYDGSATRCDVAATGPTIGDHDRAYPYDLELQHNRNAGLDYVDDIPFRREGNYRLNIAARVKGTPMQVIDELNLERRWLDRLDR